jgi:hypothetical protein
MTNDGFQPDRPPIFLSDRAEETAQPDIGRAWAIAAMSSRILKASILAATATAIGIAVLSIDNPASLVANLTDWARDKPALPPDADPPPAVQSAAGTRDTPGLPTMTTAAPPHEETATAAEPAAQSRFVGGNHPAEQSQAEVGEPITEALFKQFLAWAAEEGARAQAVPAQAAPVHVAQDAPARPVKKHRRARSAQNARAEVRQERNYRAKAREELDARGQLPPVADPRLQNPSVPTGQTPSLLQTLGLSN